MISLSPGAGAYGLLRNNLSRYARRRCGVRTSACRVEIHLDIVEHGKQLHSHECECGTHECVRHVDKVSVK